MDRSDAVLAALAPAEGAPHSPVQVQKILFLIDSNLGRKVGGPHFDFRPYHYGPFDREVYDVLERLAEEGLVEIEPGRWNTYRLTKEGQKAACEALKRLNPEASSYIGRVSEYVRKLSFTQLVAAIYRAYPAMRANSVFR